MNSKILIVVIVLQLGIVFYQTKSMVDLTEEKTQIKAKLDYARIRLADALSKDCK